ncbi:MAG: branched-chain amino acid ABC transporter substrate-binding protein [Alphaproteobacteria bacterium]|nr:branched-chain amino acid ABC transporter substrate-binding protein [Alphaproteobacteria bacterium]
MMLTRRTSLALGAVLGLALGANPALAQKKYGPGASDTEIKIGNTNPYSGPASSYGTIGKTQAAYFEMLNKEKGGINGRKVNFITLDDGYSPPKTVEQVRRLVEQDQVLAVFATLGTPTNTAFHKYINGKKVPHLFLATGATKWNDPKNHPWTIGWQPNYQTEAAIYASYIMRNHPNAKVGVLYQNDDYGKDYLHGFLAGFGDKVKQYVVAQVSYEVTDATVDSQIISLKGSGADTFFNITIPKFAAQAVRKAYDIDWKPTQFLNNVSNSIGSVLQPAGLEKSKGIISSRYYIDPTEPEIQNHPDFKEWLAFMKKYYPDGALNEPFNVYAYLSAKTLEHVLRQCGDDLTRENLIKQAASIKNLKLPMMVEGILLNTGPNDFAPIEQMQLIRFDGEKWVPFGDILG